YQGDPNKTSLRYHGFLLHKNLLRVRPSFQLRIADWSRQEAVNGNPKSAIRNRKSGILIACHLLVSARRFPMSNPKIKFVLGSVVIVAALTWLGFVGFQQSKAYYITVDEFQAMQGKYKGKTLKVAGDVV